jgi:hypothetical protein
MSAETLLLAVLLMALTLADWLVRVLRARTPSQAEEPTVSPAPREPAGMPDPAWTPPPVPPRHPTTERLSSGERVRVRRKNGQTTAAAPLHGDSPSSQRRYVWLLGQRVDLRRAMTLMVILGPCKGLEGDTGFAQDGRQA